MLLVKITINGNDRYVSADGHALTHNWQPRIISFDAPTLVLRSDHGGHATMGFGSISLSQVLFAADWPPPVSCPLEIYYTDTTEEAAELVYKGNAHVTSYDRAVVNYDLFPDSFSETYTAVTFNDTLNACMTSILTTIPEITTVDTTHARNPSPDVDYAMSSDELAIELASKMAEFFCHLFYIEGSTAYLVDLKENNGERTLNEYQYFACPEYRYKTPIASAKAGSYIRFSNYPYGRHIALSTSDTYATFVTRVYTALDDIMAIENAPITNLSIPMIAGNFPKPGEKVFFNDTGNVADMTASIRVRKIGYDFLNNVVNIEGEGETVYGFWTNQTYLRRPV